MYDFFFPCCIPHPSPHGDLSTEGQEDTLGFSQVVFLTADWKSSSKSPLRRKVRHIVADLKSSVSLRFLTLRFDKSQSSALDAWSNQNSKFPLGRRIPLDSPTQLQSHQWPGSFKREMPALGESISIFTTSLQPWHENASPHTAVSFIG